MSQTVAAGLNRLKRKRYMTLAEELDEDLREVHDNFGFAPAKIYTGSISGRQKLLPRGHATKVKGEVLPVTGRTRKPVIKPDFVDTPTETEILKLSQDEDRHRRESHSTLDRKAKPKEPRAFDRMPALSRKLPRHKIDSLLEDTTILVRFLAKHFSGYQIRQLLEAHCKIIDHYSLFVTPSTKARGPGIEDLEELECTCQKITSRIIHLIGMRDRVLANLEIIGQPHRDYMRGLCRAMVSNFTDRKLLRAIGDMEYGDFELLMLHDIDNKLAEALLERVSTSDMVHQDQGIVLFQTWRQEFTGCE